MEYIINVSEFEDDINLLERAHYEVNGRQSILGFMVSNGLEDSDNYKKFWEQYLEYMKTYNFLKDQFQKNQLSNYPNKIRHLNFTTKEVIIVDE